MKKCMYKYIHSEISFNTLYIERKFQRCKKFGIITLIILREIRILEKLHTHLLQDLEILSCNKKFLTSLKPKSLER